MINENKPDFIVQNSTQKIDKKFYTVLYHIIKILQKSMQENDLPDFFDQKYQKSDFLIKIIDYFMIDVNSKSLQEKTKFSQKYSALKSILLSYLKITPQSLEFLSEKVANKITKGKFQLSIVLHLSKNIAKSKNFQKTKSQTVIKNSKSLQNLSEVKEKELNQNFFQVKREMPTFQNQKQFQFQKRGNTCCPSDEIMVANQSQISSNSIENSKGFWNSCMDQQQYNQILYPQFYYYVIQ